MIQDPQNLSLLTNCTSQLHPKKTYASLLGPTRWKGSFEWWVLGTELRDLPVLGKHPATELQLQPLCRSGSRTSWVNTECTEDHLTVVEVKPVNLNHEPMSAIAPVFYIIVISIMTWHSGHFFSPIIKHKCTKTFRDSSRCCCFPVSMIEMALLCLKLKTSLSPSYAPPTYRGQSCALILPAAHESPRHKTQIVSVWWGVSQRPATSHETSCPVSLKKRGFVFSSAVHGYPAFWEITQPWRTSSRFRLLFGPNLSSPVCICWMSLQSHHSPAFTHFPLGGNVISRLVGLKGENDAPRFSTGYIAFGATGALMEVTAFVLQKNPFQKLWISRLMLFSSAYQRSQSETSESNPFWTRSVPWHKTTFKSLRDALVLTVALQSLWIVISEGILASYCLFQTCNWPLVYPSKSF